MSSSNISTSILAIIPFCTLYRVADEFLNDWDVPVMVSILTSWITLFKLPFLDVMDVIFRLGIVIYNICTPDELYKFVDSKVVVAVVSSNSKSSNFKQLFAPYLNINELLDVNVNLNVCGDDVIVK